MDLDEKSASKAKVNKMEECLIANYKPSAVNNINDLRLRISRNKSSRRNRSLQIEFTDEQIQRALSDPNPRMALFRASLPSSSETHASNANSLSKQVLSRTNTSHIVYQRFKPLSKSRSDIQPPSCSLFQPQFKSFLHGHNAPSLSNINAGSKAEHINQLKRQFDKKVPENQITELSMTNARRFGYSSFKIYGKRSALSEFKNAPQNKK